MNFIVKYKLQFAAEFNRFPHDQQSAVVKFLAQYQQHGLADQTKFPGRISPSWQNLPINHPNYIYTKTHDLWHYHLGIPDYDGRQNWGKTSDWLLHFQWPDQGNVISLVDVYTHHNYQKQFYLPPLSALEDSPEPDLA